MGIHAQKKQEEKSQSQSKEIAQLKNEGSEANDFLDLRPEAEIPKKMQQLADRSFRSSKLSSLQSLADSNVKTSMPIQGKFQTVQKSGLEDEELLQGKFQTVQKVEEEELVQGKFISPPKEENTTGLPDALKFGVESLSGVSLNDVKVYRNSDKPAQLQAHAYAQGTDIHLGPGQDQHLPHEAWHVVQQKQGRVKPTVKVNGDVPVNDSPSLEEEATTMGQKALNLNTQNSRKTPNNISIQRPTAQLWSMSSLFGGAKDKAKKYYDEEKGYTKQGSEIIDKEHEGGFLKGAVGGALGTVGGILGGTLGGLWGAGKSMFGMADEVKDKNGNSRKKGFFEQIRSSAFEGGTAGRDMGRVAGSGIVDGGKAIAGGVTGLATGAVGGALGGLAGIGHGIYNKFTGNGNFSDTVAEDAKFGAKGGFKVGKGTVDGTFGLVDEVPELAINSGRAALGAAGGVVGAIGGGIYGGVKGAFGHGDRKFTGKAGETNDNVKRKGVLEQMWQSGKEGMAYGARKGANSNLTKKVIGGAVSMAAATAGTALAGPVGGIAGGYAANHANARYWGESNTSADIAALTGTVSSVTSGLITPGLSGINNAAELYSAKAGNSLAGIVAGQGANILQQNFSPEDRPNQAAPVDSTKVGPKEKDTRTWGKYLKDGASYAGDKAWDLSAQGIKLGKDWTADLGNEVAEPYTLESKAGDQIDRIKGLFGFGKKKK